MRPRSWPDEVYSGLAADRTLHLQSYRSLTSFECFCVSASGPILQPAVETIRISTVHEDYLSRADATAQSTVLGGPYEWYSHLVFVYITIAPVALWHTAHRHFVSSHQFDRASRGCSFVWSEFFHQTISSSNTASLHIVLISLFTLSRVMLESATKNEW